MTQTTATAASPAVQPRRHRSVTAWRGMRVNLTLWRVLTWTAAVLGLAVGLTAPAINGQTALALVFFAAFAWMATRRYAE